MKKIIKIFFIIFSDFKQYIKLIFFKIEWRKLNISNKTLPNNVFPIEKVKVGINTYGNIEVQTYGTAESKLEIGNYVSIAPGVKFLLDGNHEVDTFTTYPFKVMFLKEKVEAWTKGKIVVKDDVWIGTDSMILSGVTVGQGAIVAAGSVVTKDVPPYAIVGGNPAKVIKYRFSEELVKEMTKFDWSKVDVSKIRDIEKELYTKLNSEIMEKIIKELK